MVVKGKVQKVASKGHVSSFMAEMSIWKVYDLSGSGVMRNGGKK